MTNKWAFYFSRYQDGTLDVLFVGSVTSVKSKLSSTGYIIYDAKVKDIIVLEGLEKEFIMRERMRLTYPWQIVDTLQEAKRLAIMGVLYGVSFGSIDVDMTNRPF